MDDVELDELELAYLAGFFDGEGTITIHHRNAETKQNWYRVCASVSSTNKEMPCWFKELFGGSVSTQLRGENRKDIYTWQVTSLAAVRFIEVIKPHLRMKSQQAEIALDFQETIHHGNVQGRRLKERGYTPDEIVYKKFLCSEIRTLNYRGLR